MEIKQLTATITEKKPYNGSSGGAPKGDFYIGHDKFACWNQDDFDKINIGDIVSIEYTEKENVTPDKTYINRSINTINLSDQVIGVDKAVPGAEMQVEYIKVDDEKEVSSSQVMRVGDSSYEVTLRKVA